MAYVSIQRNRNNLSEIEAAFLMEGKYCIGEIKAEDNGDSSLLQIPIEKIYNRGIKSLNVVIPDRAIPTPEPIPKPELPKPPYKQLIYPMKWRSQRDNDQDQYSNSANECSYTSMAMVVDSFGLSHLAKGIREQLEDEIAYRMWTEYGQTANGTVELMAKYLRQEFGLEVKVDMSATVEEMKQSLDEGCLLIVHTSLTRSGHVIAVCGYDDEAYDGKGAFVCCDPWGEYFSTGYQYGTNRGGDSRGKELGNHVPYSYRFASAGNFYWSHAVSHPTIKLTAEIITPKNGSPTVSPVTSVDSEIPKSGLDLIKEFEGCHVLRDDGRVHAYPDPLSGNLPITIGYGSTYKLDGSPFHMGDSITVQEAEQLLKKQIKTNYWDILKKTIPYWNEMNDNQRGALLSFGYNLGAHFYGHNGFSSMTRVLRNKEWGKVPETMYLYRNPGTNVEEGLARRRKAEGKLWSKPV